MQLVLLDGIDPDQVRGVVGTAPFGRARECVRERRVRHTAWNERALLLTGLVRGGHGEEYEVDAHFGRGRGGGLLLHGGSCDCPVGVDCKHVAALALTVAAAGRAAPRAPEVPGWETALDGLLEDGGREADARARTAIAVELSLVPVPAPPPVRGRPAVPSAPRLNARLVRAGRGGWVAGGLSWSKLEQSWHVGEYRTDHVRLLRDLLALHRTRSTASRYDRYGEEKQIDLAAVDSPQLWPLLDEAAQLGVQLVHGRKALGGLPRPGRARVLLDVSAADGLVVAPVLRVDAGADAGDEIPDAVPVRFVGVHGHGVVWVSAAGIRGREPALWPLHLARLDAPVPAGLQRLALGGGRLAVPAADRPRFEAEYVPRLRALAEVRSVDGSWEPPPVCGPTLVLHAAARTDHVLDLAWEWAYRVGGAELRGPFAAGGEGHRDPDAERAVLEAAATAVEKAGLEPATVIGRGTRLAGLDTLRFVTEVLPLLEGSEGVRVELDGEPAAYRDAGDALRVGVSTDEAAEGGTDWFDLDVEVTVDGRVVPFGELFRALAVDEPHLLLPDGTYFALDTPQLRALRALIEEARALQDRPGGPLRISRFQAGLWEDLAALGVVDRQARAWREQVQGLLAAAEQPPPPVPDGLRAVLRPYQAEGFGWLAFLWRHGLGGILADDMGLGKTVQTLALICHARGCEPDAPPFLVVAPTSVLPNWAAEAARFAPDLRVVVLADTLRRRGEDLATAVAGADVVLTTYTLLRLDAEHHAGHSWSGLILDEAQNAKNHQAKVHHSARRVPAPFRLAITGTPMENNLMELWSLLSITAPGLFPSPVRFRERYGTPIEKHGDAERLATLRRRIRPLVTRRTKEQVAPDLPEKSQQVLTVELDPRHRRLYQSRLQRERQKVLGLIDDVDRNRFTILRSLTLLRRLALHPGLVDDAALAAGSAKVDALVEHLVEVAGGGHRALVFSQFTGYLAIVRAALDRAGISYSYLDGSTRHRDRVVSGFREGTDPVFLISLKAGGAGLNLAEADYVFLLDPWWNPATEAQAVDRTHRIGQTRTVHVYRLIAADTIEEKVLALAARKAALVTGVLDSGDPFDGRLGADDIRELLA